MELINKAALAAEIERRIQEGEKVIQELPSSALFGLVQAYNNVLSFLDTLEVKEVDLEKEYEEYVVDDPIISVFIQNDIIGRMVAKHFFELGLSVNNPITAADRGISEEIITNLKRLEKDYRIDLTKEMEWLRQITKNERKHPYFRHVR